MSAQQISDDSHRDEHDGEHEVVALRAPVQQQGIRNLVDGEAESRYGEESQRRRPERRAMTTKSQAMMTRKGHRVGNQPARPVGQ